MPEVSPEPVADTDEVPYRGNLTDDQLKNGGNLKIKPGTDRLYYVNGRPPYRVMDYRQKSAAGVTFHYRDNANRAQTTQICQCPAPPMPLLSLQLGTASATRQYERVLGGCC